MNLQYRNNRNNGTITANVDVYILIDQNAENFNITSMVKNIE